MKTNLFTRILALLFAVLMLVSVVACTKNPDKDKESETPAETDPQTPSDSESDSESEAQISWDPKGFYNGTTFTIFAYDPVNHHTWYSLPDDIYAEQNTGDTLTQVVYQRGLLLKDKLGVQLELVRQAKQFQGEVKRDIDDGEYRYQLILPMTNVIPSLVTQKTITSVNKTGYDITYPWYDQRTTELLTIKGKTIAISSDMTFIDKLCTLGVFFNKKMVSDNKLGDLYSLVDNKQWNLTKMLEMSETVVPTIDEDGSYTRDDTYGISCQNDGAYYFYHASGLTSITVNEKGNLNITFNSEASVDVLEDVLALMSNKKLYLNAQSSATKIPTVAEMAEHFASGKALFLVRPLQSLFDISKTTKDYGIIPMPMMTEGQDTYYSPVNPHASYNICFPAKITNATMTEDVIQWLGDYSYKNLNRVFYDVVLGSRMTYDETAAKMLDFIFDSRIYDIGYIWNVAGAVRNVLTTMIGTASLTAGSVKTTIDRYIDSMGTDIITLQNAVGTLE